MDLIRPSSDFDSRSFLLPSLGDLWFDKNSELFSYLWWFYIFYSYIFLAAGTELSFGPLLDFFMVLDTAAG